MTILNELHETGCTCSYCDARIMGKAMRYGMNIPPDWSSWNSWYVIKYAPRRYLRFTLSFLYRFQGARRRSSV
jgi:hypothetical protein